MSIFSTKDALRCVKEYIKCVGVKMCLERGRVALGVVHREMKRNIYSSCHLTNDLRAFVMILTGNCQLHQ